MSPPAIPARLVEAVGLCARTLSGAPDAAAGLASSDAATLGALRAFADRAAVRARHHDPSVHLRHQPPATAAATLFTALEQARLDTLGVRWLPGVARNLLAHPGADDDGARWLAFESLAGVPVPPTTLAPVAALRTALPATLVDGLTALAVLVDRQEVFAAAAALWVQAALPYAASMPIPSAPPNRPLVPTRYVEVHRRRDAHAGSGGKSRKAARREEAPGQSITPSGESTGPSGGPLSGLDYRVYTTAYDRVVDASALATRAELDELRRTLEAELGAARSLVNRLAKRLLRVLMSRQVRHWEFDLDEGVIDGARLAALVASGGRARPFRRESESRFPSTVVSLLIDHSGSMQGRPMRIAALTVEIFARVLERCGVRCEVLGFTTRDWNGGDPAREWAEHGYPEHPGRLNALEHIVVKDADVPWRRARVALGLFLRDEMLKENIDGEALRWAHGRLLSRSERRRILVVVSDGTPMDEATMAANGHDYLERHLQAVVKDIERWSAVRLAAIGIGHDVSTFYENAATIARIDQLGPALGRKLMALLAD